MLTRRLLIVPIMALLIPLSACSSPSGAATSAEPMQVVVEDVWARTTAQATDPSMTSLFMTLVNPGDADIALVSASSADAGKVELHESVDVDGARVMRPVSEIPIRAGSHVHLATGGYHIMLMELRRPLPLGDEVTVTLRFSSGQTTDIVAPTKDLAEQGEHYHPGDATPSTASASASASARD